MMLSPSECDPKARCRMQVRGVVQGVGFRPFVYKLATRLNITGFVFNSSSGVTIESEGTPAAIAEFRARLVAEAPQLAKIAELSVTEITASGSTSFEILASRGERGGFALAPPDAGTCDACWRELEDPSNRRFSYPFSNCTQCGPRYTIIQDVPYDRAKTTMSGFVMCPECQAEYDNPADRRFHAQPNACAVCGPSLCLVPSGASIAECSFAAKDALSPLRKARQVLREGGILAVKGLGGFLLACDARNGAAVAELRIRKRRPAKPFALMARDPAAAKSICAVSPDDEAALLDQRRPIVVLPRLISTGAAGAGLPEELAPGNNTLGVMLPYTPLHFMLFGNSADGAPEFSVLVMTSGNLSEEPIVVSNEEALIKLAGVADWFLLHNREIATRVDDSVVRTFGHRACVLRRARGFTPQSIDLGLGMKQILAVGAELKSTFCLTQGSHAILSQHLGDMENYETVQFFEETLAKMKHLFKVAPLAVAHDLHPGYRSTRIALASGIERRFAVQHHHAHIASCMAENHLQGKVIGVAMDGTGLGSDGTIWGGEFLVADFAGFERRGHLRGVPMAGGDAAVRQPWRMALSYLREAFGAQIPDGVAAFRGVSATRLALVDQMLTRHIQTVETSSCGRLFDAVAALVGLGAEVTFEGQAAVALEMAAEPGFAGRYPFDVEQGETLVVDLRATIQSIVRDFAAGRSVAEISACFHRTLAAAIVKVCCLIQKRQGLSRVCLSGGVFQNFLLLELTTRELSRHGFGVFLHSQVPANDGGIALGQAVIANELLHRAQAESK